MKEFAKRTGLSSGNQPRRYLWTDAFAVCNFLGLRRKTGDSRFAELALSLIEQVHDTLGRHREDDYRDGWISGLDEQTGENHPTAGGLRIGKKLPERKSREPFDSRLEWERDGQYFHYLTKWAHALDLTARETKNSDYALWACELAHTAGKAFVRINRSGRICMYWKMSIDLSRPLVESMGHHDPLDGYIILRQIRETLSKIKKSPTEEMLTACAGINHWISIFQGMTTGINWDTLDSLGIGGLLIDATRLAQLTTEEAAENGDLILDLLISARTGLDRLISSGALEEPAEGRLAFRELGMAIGLRGSAWMMNKITSSGRSSGIWDDILPGFQGLEEYYSTGDDIISFWLNPENQSNAAWQDNLDINSVMLATALEPGGFINLKNPEVIE